MDVEGRYVQNNALSPKETANEKFIQVSKLCSAQGKELECVSHDRLSDTLVSN